MSTATTTATTNKIELNFWIGQARDSGGNVCALCVGILASNRRASVVGEAIYSPGSGRWKLRLKKELVLNEAQARLLVSVISAYLRIAAEKLDEHEEARRDWHVLLAKKLRANIKMQTRLNTANG